MSYKYNEPEERNYEPLPEGNYGFTVFSIDATYNNDKGTFILPVEIHLAGTDRKLKQWLSAGIDSKGKAFDMIAPFLKSIRRNPAVGEEPDFSSRNIVGTTGVAHVKEKLYAGKDEKYQGMTFPTVAWWVYDREKTGATISDGKSAQDRVYGKGVPASQMPPLDKADDDNVPF